MRVVVKCRTRSRLTMRPFPQSPSGLWGTANTTGRELLFPSPTEIDFSSVMPVGRKISQMAAGAALDYFFDGPLRDFSCAYALSQRHSCLFSDADALYVRGANRRVSNVTNWNSTTYGSVSDMKAIMSTSPFTGPGDKISSTVVMATSTGGLYSLGPLDGLMLDGGVNNASTDCPLLQTVDNVNYRLCTVDTSNCPGGTYRMMATGQDFAIVLTSNGLCGWGSNENGVFGDPGTIGTAIRLPLTVNVRDILAAQAPGTGGAPPPGMGPPGGMPPPGTAPPPGMGAPGGMPPPGTAPPPGMPPPGTGAPFVPPPGMPPPGTGAPPPSLPPPPNAAPKSAPVGAPFVPPPGMPPPGMPPPGMAPPGTAPPPGMPPPGMGPPPGVPPPPGMGAPKAGPPVTKRSVEDIYESTATYASGDISGSSMSAVYAGSSFIYLEYQPVANDIFTSTIYVGWGGLPEKSRGSFYELAVSDTSAQSIYFSSNPRLISILTPSSTKLIHLAGRNVFTCIYNDPSDANGHSCYVFGRGFSGELGQGSSAPAATLVPLSGVFFGRSVDAIESMKSTWAKDEQYSSAASFAVVDGGTGLISWGDGREGKTAVGASATISDLSLSGGTFRVAAATRDTFAYVSRTGVLYTLGANTPTGILGNGDTDSTGSSTPVTVLPNLVSGAQLAVASIASLTAGEGFFAALAKTDFNANSASVIIWWGLVPTSPVSSLANPTEVTFATSNRYRLLSCGRAHCIAVEALPSGKVIAWGMNANFQVDNSSRPIVASTAARQFPAPLFGVVNGTQIIQIAASDTFSSVLVDDGRVFWWGSMSFSAPRDLAWYCSERGSQFCAPKLSANFPALLPGFLNVTGRITNLFAGWYGAFFSNHTHSFNAYEDANFAPSGYLILRTDNGSLWGWGANSFGTLGIDAPLGAPVQGNPTNWDANLVIESPIAVYPSINFTDQVSAGSSHVVALDTQGNLRVWGTSATSGAFGGVSAIPSLTSQPLTLNSDSAANILTRSDGLSRRRLITGVWGRYSTFALSRAFITGDENSNFYASTPSLTITGNEFGTDTSAVQVRLSVPGENNSTLNIFCTATSVIDTKIICTPSGNSSLYRAGTISAFVEVNEQRTTNAPVAVLRESFSLSTPASPTKLTLLSTSTSLQIPGANLPNITGSTAPTFDVALDVRGVTATCAFFAISSNNAYCTLSFAGTNATIAEIVDGVSVFVSMSFNGVTSSSVVAATIARLPSVVANTNRLARSGATLVIRGAGFDSSTPASAIVFDPAVLFEVQNSNETQISVSLEGSSRTGVTTVTISAFGGQSQAIEVVNLVDPVSLIVPNPPKKFSTSKGWIVVDGYGWNANEPDKIPRINLQISSNGTKRALATVPCVTNFTSSGSVNCSFSTLPAAGNLSLEVTLWGSTSSFGFGAIVPAPSVIEPPARKLAATGSYQITITGDSFTDQNGDATVPIFSPTITCTTVSSTNTQFVCKPVGALPEGNLTVAISANGGPSNYVQIATVVAAPTITASATSVTGLTSAITISGANFHDDPLQNVVSLTVVPNGGSSTPLNCSIDVFASSKTQIVCSNLQLGSIAAPAPILASVSSYSSDSTPVTQVATIAAPDTPTGNNNVAQLKTGDYVGIGVGIVAAIIIAIICAALVVRWRVRKAKEEQVMKMQDQFRDQLEAQHKEAKDVFNIKASDIIIQSKLGEGSYGAVFLALYKKKHVAVKKLIASTNGNQASEFFREASLMLALKDHPNVVKVHGMCQEQANFSLVLEFLPGGSLDGFIESQNYGEDIMWTFAYGIANGMASLASQGIVHRDLAARNVLLDNNFTPKVADFGYARNVGSNESGVTAANVGPIRWMPPEAIGAKIYSEATDVWAYACTLYEIVAKEEPFRGVDLVDVAVKVRDTGANAGIPDGTPRWMENIMLACWQVNPAERPTFQTICDLLITVKPANVNLPSAGSYTPTIINGRGTNAYDEFGPSAEKVEKDKKNKKNKGSAYDDVNMEMDEV